MSVMTGPAKVVRNCSKTVKVATKILAFEDGSLKTFHGNYTDYLDEKAFAADTAAQLSKAESPKTPKRRQEKKRMSYFEKQEWEGIEEEITQLESDIAAIEAAMLANASDYGELAILQRDLDTKNDQLLAKYERYEYLSDLADSWVNGDAIRRDSWYFFRG